MNTPLGRLPLLGIGCWLCCLTVVISARSLHEAGFCHYALLVLLSLVEID